MTDFKTDVQVNVKQTNIGKLQGSWWSVQKQDWAVF